MISVIAPPRGHNLRVRDVERCPGPRRTLMKSASVARRRTRNSRSDLYSQRTGHVSREEFMFHHGDRPRVTAA